MFKRMELTTAFRTSLRGRNGPLRVTDTPRHRMPLLETMIEAAQKIGPPPSPDLSRATQEDRHVAGDHRPRAPANQPTAISIRRGRANFTIEQGAMVETLVLEGEGGAWACAIRWPAKARGRGRRARSSSVAARISSPKALVLSGIRTGRAPARAWYGAGAAQGVGGTYGTIIRRA